MREEVLPEIQRQVLTTIAPITRDLRLYLGGGTAIALQLGHRRSIDFDWFSEEPRFHVERAIEAFRAVPGFALELREEGTILAAVQGVRVACFSYRYARLDPLVDDAGIHLAGLWDLAAMKLLAVAQRGSRKDFIDIQVLLNHGLTLAEMLDAFQRKFDVTNRMTALRGLVYFDDAEEEPMPDMLVPLDWAALKIRFRRLVDGVISSPSKDRS